MKEFFKKLLAPWRSHPNKINTLVKEVQESNKMISERTTVHADVHLKSGMDNIIVVGRYKNHDYVRCFEVESRDFHGLIETLRRIEPSGRVGRIDVPFPSFSGVVERLKRERGQG